MRSYDTRLLDFCQEALRATGETRKVVSVTFGPHPLEARMLLEDNTERNTNGLIVTQMKQFLEDEPE